MVPGWHCYAKQLLWRYAIEDIASYGMNLIEIREMGVAGGNNYMLAHPAPSWLLPLVSTTQALHSGADLPRCLPCLQALLALLTASG